MSRQIYASFAFEEGDDLETKQRKLYLAAISIGEDLYSIGADLSEIRKKLDAFESVVTNVRSLEKELRGAAQGEKHER